MNDTFELIYSLINGTNTLGGIADYLKGEFPEVQHQIEIDLIKCVQDQITLGLIEPAPSSMLPIQYRDRESDLELCIIFVYHNVDEITVQNFNLLTWMNPDAVIAPVCVNTKSTILGFLETVDVSEFPGPWDLSNVWRNLDAVVYTWFRNRPLNAKRYILMEYDCLCTLPLKEAYSTVWESDVAAKEILLPETHDYWQWFSETHLLDETDRSYMAGLSPMACMLFSHHALEQISAAEVTNPVFCELRIGTTARRLGLHPEQFDFRMRKTVHYVECDYDFSIPGVFHPVKEAGLPQLTPPPGKCLKVGMLSPDSLVRTVVVVPSGRKRYLRILMCYLDQLHERGLIDELHLWVNTDVESDLEYINSIADERRWARTIHSNKPKIDMGVARFLDYCKEPDTVYVRIDDDVVFVDVDNFERFIAFRKQHHQYFVVYANTINNSLCSYLHQRLGAIDDSLGMVEFDCFDPVSWSSGDFAELAHRSFFRHLKSGTLDQFRFDIWKMAYAERLSTHFISWLGADFAVFEGVDQVEDDEHWLSCVQPGKIEKPNVIYGSMLACHFAYYPQRQLADRSHILSEYERLVGL